MTPYVEIRGLTKRYEGVQALRDVTLSVARGEIHALVGENGAGKSTLGKAIAGAVTVDSGEIRVDGNLVRYRTPRDGLMAGIALVHQEIALIPCLSATENIFLGAESTAGIVRQRARRERMRNLMEESGFTLTDVESPVSSLSIAEQQKVEIIRALARGARLIVMDEPTAPLTSDESERLYALIRSLRDRGRTIVYISHFLEEVLALANTISVLKDGHLVRTSPAEQETVPSLISAMLGRSLETTFPKKDPPPESAPIILEASGLTRQGVIDDISFSIRRGEILGLAGLVGSGRTEVARAIFAADRLDRGEVKVNGKRARPHTPRGAIRNGIALLPESRKEQGLLMTRPVHENLVLPHLHELMKGGLISPSTEQNETAEASRRVDVRAPSLNVPVATLSGGNQQKVMFAKWLLRPPLVLIADEPTRGVDVGAKRAIYDLIQREAARGMAVLLISSELEEIMGLSHRILVMHRGRLVAEFDANAASNDVLAAAFGNVAVGGGHR